MKKYFKLFLSMLKIGLIGFGGGNALVPVMSKNLVQKDKLVTQEEFEQDVLVANITPGALPVEIAGGIGHRVGGWQGMFIGSMGMAFPGALFTTIALIVSNSFDTQSMVLKVITAIISAYIIWLLFKYVKKDIRKESWYVVLCVFILSCWKNVFKLFNIEDAPFFKLSAFNIFLIAFFIFVVLGEKTDFLRVATAIVFSCLFAVCHATSLLPDYVSKVCSTLMVIIAVLFLIFQINNNKAEKSKLTRKVDFIACVVLIGVCLIYNFDFAKDGAISSLMSFGGGDAYLTLADSLFVEKGLISSTDFYAKIVPIVNVLPGSILCKTLTAIGFVSGDGMLRSILGALTGFFVSIAASCGVFTFIAMIYEQIKTLPSFVLLQKWIHPIVSGLLLNVMLSLANNFKIF